ncbi:MAG: hypothetical protein WD399_08795 [Thermoleophilaceae bacterium]
MVGVAAGERDGAPCIVVLVGDASAPGRAPLPSEIEGFPVDVRSSGDLRAL